MGGNGEINLKREGECESKGEGKEKFQRLLATPIFTLLFISSTWRPFLFSTTPKFYPLSLCSLTFFKS